MFRVLHFSLEPANLELKAMLERHFKMKTAPKGAVEFA